MTRPRIVPGALLVVLLVCLAAFPAVAAATPTGTGAPPAAASLAACHRSASIAARSVTVATTMRPVGAGKHLLVRIDLYQRSMTGGRWILRSDVPGLSTWTPPSDPSIGSRPNDVFKYRQAVGRLVVPYQYRFKVGFKWLDSSSRVVRTSSTWTATCKQPDLRPDLTITRVKEAPDYEGPSAIRYFVLVKNQGLGVARDVDVAAQFGDVGDAAAAPVPDQTIARLAPHATATVEFDGPGCVATGGLPPVFTVDPDNMIDEANETNNTLAALCPGA